MSATRPLLLGATCLALLLSHNVLLADPGNGKNNSGHGNKGHNSQHEQDKTHKNSQSGSSNYSREDNDDEDFRRRYNDDSDAISRIFRQHSGSYGQIDSLPPGIRKNLARGKPLPPGIAKKLDPNVARQLPYYQGYEWQQIGNDAALIDITSGVVSEIMRDVLH